MDCKKVSLNKSILKFDFTFKNTGSSFTHILFSVHERNEADHVHSASQYPRRLNLLTYPLTFLQTDEPPRIYRAKRTRRNEFSPVSGSFTARYGRIYISNPAPGRE